MNKLNKILWGIISGFISVIYNLNTCAATEYKSTTVQWGKVQKGDTYRIEGDWGSIIYTITNIQKTGDDTTGDRWAKSYISCITDFDSNGNQIFLLADEDDHAGVRDTFDLPEPPFNQNYYLTLVPSTQKKPSNYNTNLAKCPDNGLSYGITYDLYTPQYGSSVTCYFMYDDYKNTRFHSAITMTISKEVCDYNDYYCQVQKNDYFLMSKTDTTDVDSIKDCYKNPTDGIDNRGSYTYSDDTKCYYQ